jgi:hypothetical protein
MNKETFMNCTIANVSQVYIGKDNHCRCGCGGEYTATSYMQNPRSEVNDKLVEKQLNRAKKLISGGVKHEFNGTYVNISTGNNRALTIYFNGLK